MQNGIHCWQFLGESCQEHLQQELLLFWVVRQGEGRRGHSMWAMHFPSHKESWGQRCLKTRWTHKCPVHIVTLRRRSFESSDEWSSHYLPNIIGQRGPALLTKQSFQPDRVTCPEVLPALGPHLPSFPHPGVGRSFVFLRCTG